LTPGADDHNQVQDWLLLNNAGEFMALAIGTRLSRQPGADPEE
jgi:hypothetical protein